MGSVAAHAHQKAEPVGILLPAAWAREHGQRVRRTLARRNFHGKEGVSGSSPEEGFAKAPQSETFFFRINLQVRELGAGMEPLWSLQVENAVRASRVAAREARPRHSKVPLPQLI